MTERLPHLAHLQRLWREGDAILRALEAGQAPEFDAFTERRAALLTALQALGPVAPTSPDIAAWQTGLEQLQLQTETLNAVLSGLRDRTRERLVVLGRGRRGLVGYGAANSAGRARGSRHGQG